MANVRFVRTTKEKQINRGTYDQNALYFCTDSREFYRADQLLTDGVRVVASYNQLPELKVAADGILYFVEDTKNGYVLNATRDGWLQVVYAPNESLEALPEGSTIATTETVLEVREEILTTVYTKEQIDAMGLGKGVESIRFAGVELASDDGVFSIDKEAALGALGITMPESAEGETVVIATETVVTEKVAEMSDELKTYIDEQIKNVEADSMDGGEFT
jgi:hypothetical protein